MVGPVAVGDSIVVEHIALLEHTAVESEQLELDCTVVAMQIVLLP